MLILITLSGCYKPGPGAKPWQASWDEADSESAQNFAENWHKQSSEMSPVGIIESTPTPNPPIALPAPRTETITHVIQKGDTLRKIALKYQVSINQIVTVNEIVNPDLIDEGLVLQIPPSVFDAIAPSFKIVPDSELINSPGNAGFDVLTFVDRYNGYLAFYTEEIESTEYNGPAIVERVAVEYSINPRLLLSLLEFQSAWVTDPNPAEETLNYPMRYYDPWYTGLYKQLGWAANLLNEGYYLWKVEAINSWMLSDSTMIKVEPTINAGTAGVLNLMRYLTTQSDWERAISETGVFETFSQFFGYPFNFAIEPILPKELVQPKLQLPFEDEAEWSFTGGPHGGWNTGSAWAALDFAPPGEALGCFPSEEWVVASAPGLIVYSDHGAVIQDLDGDGIWQTGWSILYMHMATGNRVPVGTYLEAGDRVGHPSCEGGFSTGTHLHIARRFNGEWIAADSALSFIMDGWESIGYGVEYDGYLVKGDLVLEAWNGRAPINAIQR